jgi:hypothetical protein
VLCWSEKSTVSGTLRPVPSTATASGSRMAEVVAHPDVRILELEGEVARLGARVEVLNGVCHRAYEANNRAGRSTTEREVRAGVAEVRRVLLGTRETGSCSKAPVTGL